MRSFFTRFSPREDSSRATGAAGASDAPSRATPMSRSANATASRRDIGKSSTTLYASLAASPARIVAAIKFTASRTCTRLVYARDARAR